MPDILFIYGTLHPDRAPADIASTAHRLHPFGGAPARGSGVPNNRATIPGQLHDLGAYPGVTPSEDPADIVDGELFLLPEGPDSAAVLALIDEYEDFRPPDPANSLFLRRKVIATLQDGPDAGTAVACWVYLYNRPIP